MFENKKYIAFFNIIIILALFCIFFIYNQSLFIIGHDRFHAFFSDISSFVFPSARLPALIINSLYHKILPNLFGMHPQDFRDNYIVCSILSIYFLSIVIIFAQGFFISCKKQEFFLFRKENLLIIPCCFLIFALQKTNLFCNFRELAVFLEYHGGYPLYFIFFGILFKIILQNKPISKIQLVFFSFVSLLLGMWSEYINIPAFLSLLIIIIANMLFCRNNSEFQSILKNKKSLCMVLCFLLGFIFFYCHNGNYGINSFGTLGDYNIFEHLRENLIQIKPFTKEFIRVMFLDYYIVWIIFVVFTVLYKIYLIKNPDKYGSVLLFLCFSLLLGFFITSYCSIFFITSRNTYLFNLFGFPLIGYHITIFVTLILLGYLKDSIKNNAYTILLSALAIIFIYFLSKTFIPIYLETVKYNTDTKTNMHYIEKTLLIYSIFGESAKFPQIFTQHYEKRDYCITRIFPYKNKIYSKIDDFFDYVMLKEIYKHQLIGYQIYSETIAKENLQKRVKYLGEIKPKYNIFRQIQYNDIKEYDKINLSMQDIVDLETKYGEDSVLTKAKAYLYYTQKDYNQALKLYSEYSKQNPEDYDALLNMAEIYKIQKNYDAAEKIYLDLYKRDNENLFVIYNLNTIFVLKNIFGEYYNYFLLYDYELYEEGLIPELQFIKALTYKKIGNINKAEEIISKLNDDYKKEFYNK